MNIFTHIKRLSCLVSFAALASSPAFSATYNINAFPFSFMGATSATGTITTNTVGSFTSAAAIENIFNTSTFSMSLYNGASVLSTINNANSSWALNLMSATAQLVLNGTTMSLTFDTPFEGSSAVLAATSNDLRTQLQFRQENNVTDYGFVSFAFDAMHMANASTNYGSSFVLPAAATVAEPESLALMLAGLGLVGFAARRRNAATACTA